MKKIKKSFKPILLISLLTIMAVLLLMPLKSDAVMLNHPGLWGTGTFGKTCDCPWLTNSDCFCAVYIPDY